MSPVNELPDGGLPRVLIVESDPEVARLLVCALATARAGAPREGVNEVPANALDVADCHVVQSLSCLHRVDLRSYGVALVASVFSEGCGLDAVAYLRGLAPHLPVIMIGDVADAAMAPEAIRAGASEFVLLTGHEAVTVPLAVKKAIVHRQLKIDNDQLQQSLTRSMTQQAEVNRRLEQTVSQLEDLARTDDLTGLTNRRWLNLMLEGRWTEAERHGIGLGFLLIDLDGFKGLNDSLGHHRGDDVLKRVGVLMKDICRDIDIAARYGGDEFCILLPHADLEATLRVGRRLVDCFEAAVDTWDLGDTRLGISVGASHRSLCSATDSDELVQFADEAMYAAKRKGVGLMLHAGITTTPRMQVA